MRRPFRSGCGQGCKTGGQERGRRVFLLWVLLTRKVQSPRLSHGGVGVAERERTRFVSLALVLVRCTLAVRCSRVHAFEGTGRFEGGKHAHIWLRMLASKAFSSRYPLETSRLWCRLAATPMWPASPNMIADCRTHALLSVPHFPFPRLLADPPRLDPLPRRDSQAHRRSDQQRHRRKGPIGCCWRAQRRLGYRWQDHVSLWRPKEQLFQDVRDGRASVADKRHPRRSRRVSFGVYDDGRSR